MKIVELCVRRPIMTFMMVSCILVLGAVSYTRLGVDLFPNIDFPFVSIQTTLKGSSPEEIETSITKPIEESVNTISGIEDLNSTSYEGLSVVFIKFVLEKNVDVAAQEARDKVNAVIKNLPQGTDQPVVGKWDVSASAILNVVVSGERDLIDLTEITKKKIKENIETVNGVGSVTLVGGREREIHIIVNPLKMAALNISIKQVKDALTQQNVEIPGGKIEQADKEYVLRTLGRISSAEQFKNVVVATRNNTPVRISDIGRVEDSGQFMETASYLNGKPSVTLVITKQSGTNTVAVAKEVRNRLDRLKPIIPKDMSIKVIGDQSIFIKDSVNTVLEHLILGALCAAVMVLVFMGDIRSTIISALAIPTSIVGTFIFMQLAGFTLNNMTLLGLTISVGLVIDDAIVMLENIHRHMEEYSRPAREAALEGAEEIGFAVIAMSLSLLVIFLPLAYMSGIIGRFMKSYGLTIAGAIAISTFIALTLTPTLCSLFLKASHGKKTKMSDMADRINDYLADKYLVMLKWAMNHKKFMVVSSIIIMLSTIPLGLFIGKDFVPQDDTSKFQVNITAPEGTSLEQMRRIFTQLDQEIKTMPYVKDTLSTIGKSGSTTAVNKGAIVVELAELNERSIPQEKMIAATRKMLSKYTALRTSVNPVGGFGSGNEYDLTFVIAGPDLVKLQEYAGKVAQDLKARQGINDVDLSFSYAKPEYRVVINRDRAQDMGVKVEDIATSLRTFVSGSEDITKYKEGDELYQVRIRADERYRNRPEIVAAMQIPATGGGTVRLDSVATLQEGSGPTQIDRYNRQRQITVQGNLSGMPLGKALSFAQAAFDKQHAPVDYRGEI